jgi:hypothetical protein
MGVGASLVVECIDECIYSSVLQTRIGMVPNQMRGYGQGVGVVCVCVCVCVCVLVCVRVCVGGPAFSISFTFLCFTAFYLPFLVLSFH